MYTNAILNQKVVDLGETSKLYKDMLVGKEDKGKCSKDEDLSPKKINESIELELDFSDFAMVEELDGEKHCPTFIILEAEESKMCKP